jgi:PBSX family phage terminase large subunit
MPVMPLAFSPKQREVLTWWRGRGGSRFDALICDGAVRSGKTLCLGLSFFLWAMARFRNRQFALCGKTTEAVRRNLLVSVLPLLENLGFRCEEKRSRGQLIVRCGGRVNTFYLFGGKDEGSAALIQGMTLAGVLLDEVALMPRSFVEQACARCSVNGAKFWFSCNPQGPGNWFYQEWILKCAARNGKYLHFTMADNPSLSVETRARYARAFQGAFYRRFILGEWTAAEGLVYDFFDESYVKPVPGGGFSKWCVSVDYGTRNPTSMGLWGLHEDGVWYRVREFYYDARAEQRQKTDGEYVEALRKLAGNRVLWSVVIDPSAASFGEALRRAGFPVRRARNEVLSGIRLTAQALQSRKIVVCEPCADAVREFASYVWDLREGARDQVRKEFDHAMDEIRYFVATVVYEKAGGFSAGSVERSI